MRPALRCSLALLTSALLLCAPAIAYDTPLSEQAVREAYFLRQRRDESMYAYLNKYTKLLPPPKTGPHISAVSFLTPFALLVQYSSRQSDYSAQRAALDHKAHEEIVAIQVEIQLTQSYGAVIATPTHSRSGSPTAFQQRSPEFWRALNTASSTATKRLRPRTSPASRSINARRVEVALLRAPLSISSSPRVRSSPIPQAWK